MDYKEIIKKQLDGLPEDLRDYVIYGDWAETLESLLVKYSVEEYKKTLIENELFLVLIGLENYKDLPINIQREADLGQSIAEDIGKKIIENILKIKIDNSQSTNIQNKVGQDFEEILLNQARAMKPAREINSSQQPAVSIKVPENLPTEQEYSEENKIHNYIGQDPYREPIE